MTADVLVPIGCQVISHPYVDINQLMLTGSATKMTLASFFDNQLFQICVINQVTTLKMADKIRARFLSLARSKLRLCSANHRAGYFSNLACDWLSIVWAYSEQETENGPWWNIIQGSTYPIEWWPRTSKTTSTPVDFSKVSFYNLYKLKKYTILGVG